MPSKMLPSNLVEVVLEKKKPGTAHNIRSIFVPSGNGKSSQLAVGILSIPFNDSSTYALAQVMEDH
jgi:hypothetical protein